MCRAKQCAVILAALLLWTGGCVQSGQTIPPASGVETEETDMTETIILTEEEEKLLCDAYLGEDRIREGKLYGYQMTCLEQIRFGREYLEQKYPGAAFSLLAVRPMDKLNSVTEIRFTEGSAPDTCYDLQIRETQGVYQAADNYYAVLIRDVYDTAVTQLLVDAGLPVCWTYTNFADVKGPEIDGSLDAAALFALGSGLGRDTVLLLEGDTGDQEANQNLVQTVRTVMLENGLYGSCCACIAPGAADRAARGQAADLFGDPAVYKERFNCFELR